MVLEQLKLFEPVRLGDASDLIASFNHDHPRLACLATLIRRESSGRNEDPVLDSASEAPGEELQGVEGAAFGRWNFAWTPMLSGPPDHSPTREPMKSRPLSDDFRSP